MPAVRWEKNRAGGGGADGNSPIVNALKKREAFLFSLVFNLQKPSLNGIHKFLKLPFLNGSF